MRRTGSKLWFVTVMCGCWAIGAGPAVVAAGLPTMVKDMTTFPAGSDLSSITKAGNTVFFRADDGQHGFELWKTDGTPEGTALVKDIIPDAASGLSRGLPMIAVDSTLFFWTDDGIHGAELWKSDGTETGTVLVKDTMPGEEDAGLPWFTDRIAICGSGGLLFFGLDDHGGIGYRLWKSDGTEAGTILVKDINPSGDPRLDEMVDINGTLFFSADDGVHGLELWKSDGTEVGTVMVKDINPAGDSSPAWMTLFDGKVFFSADNGVIGAELWTTDGTEDNTILFQNINTIGASSSFPAQLAAIDGKLYFSAWNVNHTEPWVTDGTPGTGHTIMLKNISAFHSNPKNFTECNGLVYFQASSALGFGLWKTDGTSAGTKQVKSPVLPKQMTAVGDTLFYLDKGLWMSDGTSGGTVEVSEAFPATLLGDDEMVELDGALLLTGSDRDHGNELWRFNPTTGTGGSLVKDIHTGTESSTFYSDSDRQNFLEIDGVVYFSARVADAEHDATWYDASTELWRTDGTSDGTYLVKDIRPGSDSSEPERFVNVNGTLFFTANDGVHERELWRSDGTEAGTVMVKDIFQGDREDDGDAPEDLVEYHGLLFFSADDNEHGRELWKSDGTEDGTVMVKDIYPGRYGSSSEGLTVYQDRLFFGASEGTNGLELWTSDGMEAGTRLFKDLDGSSAGSRPSGLTVAGDTLYFMAPAQPAGGYKELWKSDGTPDGTVMVKGINPSGHALQYNTAFAFMNGLLFFEANDGTHGAELWVSNGTEEGTTMVKDINQGEGGAYPGDRGFAVANGFLFFSAQDYSFDLEPPPGATGRELWTTDGTEVGTMLVRDIRVDQPQGNGPEQLIEVNGTVYFVVDDGVHGEEVWATDGTEDGTQLLIDLWPGYVEGLGSVPKILGTLGGGSGGPETLLFAGDDYFHGFELWKVTAPSGFALIGPIREIDGKFSFRFKAVSGRTYQIDRSADLDTWSTLDTFNDREGETLIEDADAIGADYFFYRVLETDAP